MSDTDTPHPAAEGAQKVNFRDVWIEADNQRRRYEIWRDHFAAEAATAREQTPPAIDYAQRCDALAADRGRLVAVYETIVRLIEGVRDDAVILERLAAARAARAAAEAAEADAIEERLAAARAARAAAEAAVADAIEEQEGQS